MKIFLQEGLIEYKPLQTVQIYTEIMLSTVFQVHVQKL